MNLHIRPGARVRLLSTAVAMPMDLAPLGERGMVLDNDAVHEQVLGPQWRTHPRAIVAPLDEPTVRTRQWVREATALDLATEAARRALQAASMPASDLAAILCVTSTPPIISAAMAARIGRALGCGQELDNASGFDIRAGGVGVMMAWFTAQGLIAQGSGPVLIVAAEAASSFLMPGDIGSALLYADGAGACILAHGDSDAETFMGGMSGQVALHGRPTTIPGLLPPHGDLMDYRYQRPDRAHLQELLHLWDRFPRVLASAFPRACQQLRHFLPYAVSTRQMDTARQALGQPKARVFHELARHGCVGAASPLVALHGLRASGQAHPGAVIALASAAGNGLWAGFFWRLG